MIVSMLMTSMCNNKIHTAPLSLQLPRSKCCRPVSLPKHFARGTEPDWPMLFSRRLRYCKLALPGAPSGEFRSLRGVPWLDRGGAVQERGWSVVNLDCHESRIEAAVDERHSRSDW